MYRKEDVLCQKETVVATNTLTDATRTPLAEASSSCSFQNYSSEINFTKTSIFNAVGYTEGQERILIIRSYYT